MKQIDFRILSFSFPALALTLVLLGCGIGELKAQHYQFSQFYAAPSYINPAFTGANVCSRLSLNYRKQWPGIGSSFETYQATYDHTLKKVNSGIGIQFFSDNTGVGGFKTTMVTILYSYEAKINKYLVGRGGIGIGTAQRQVDFGSFLFADQIARGGAEQTLENLSPNTIHYMDISIGGLLYTRDAWVGISGRHVNEPNQSLVFGSSPLPTEVMVHGGYKLIIDQHESDNKRNPNIRAVTFTFNYKNQNKFNQMDLGVYYSRDYFTLGCWYRGIPIYKPVKSYQNNDAFVFLFGVTVSRFKIGYSYDYTVSKLTNAQTNGTHEISMAYQVCNLKKEKKKKSQLISCPKF